MSQRAKSAYDKGDVPVKYESHSGDVICLHNDEPEQETHPIGTERDLISIEEDVPEPTINTQPEVNKEVKEEPKVKNEPIEIDSSPPRKRARIEPTPQQNAPRNDLIDDEELERKKEKARELAEEIETEMRLAKLQRQRRDLREEIEAAERRRRQCK